MSLEQIGGRAAGVGLEIWGFFGNGDLSFYLLQLEAFQSQISKIRRGYLLWCGVSSGWSSY